jgi:FkbM family methyltransferase
MTVSRPIDDYWAEVNTYNPLGMSRPDHVAVLFKIFMDSYPESVLHRENLNKYFLKSHGQLYQDLIVQMYLGWKSNGYFVEFGATDGYGISNTYLLEKEFSWNGILAEPARYWHDKLPTNRSCNIDFNCVWKNTGEKLMFHESSNRPDASAIEQYITLTPELTQVIGGNSSNYEVETISLLDLLKKYNAPKDIDYLSLDTEGSEIEILRTFDFDQYKIKFLTVEHNAKEENRQAIYTLLTSKGYDRVLKHISNWDDFYVLKEYNTI